MKHSTRQALGPLYPLLMRAKAWPPIAAAVGRAGAVPYALERRGAAAPVIDLTAPIGMGALICHALLFHAWFEATGQAGAVRATSPLYSQGAEDVFARFFERESSANSPALSRWATEYLIARRRPGRLALTEAQRLFAAHFRPGPALAQALAAATDCPRFDLSIHFRGTDKFLESGRVAYAPMFAAIRTELAGRTTARAFLATDDAAFAAALRAEFPGLDCTSYDLGEVTPGVPRHYSDLSPTDKAREALVNVFLLARAPVCLRTSSYLSAVSALANPGLRTVTINQTLGAAQPFPEGELLDRERAAAW